MEDEGLNPADRPQTLRLLFRRHGRESVQPTVPTRVEILRTRTGMIEAWEVIAWLPLSSEFVAWRRDTNLDHRLKAKEFAVESDGSFEGYPIELADHWTDEPADDEGDEIDANAKSLPPVDEKNVSEGIGSRPHRPEQRGSGETRQEVLMDLQKSQDVALCV